jgi:hypothetical protein
MIRPGYGEKMMTTTNTGKPVEKREPNRELTSDDLEVASGGGCVYLNFGLFQVVAGKDGGYVGASVCDGSGQNCTGVWVPVK